MRKILIATAALTVEAALAEAVIVYQVRDIDPWRLAALVESFALILGVFVALTSSTFVRQLRQWAVDSPAAALGMPLTLLIPYFIYTLGTGTFRLEGLGKLTAYIIAPTLLLFPDRLHKAERAGWRDLLAMLALGFPVAANWFRGVWMWPQELYFFRPLFCVCAGAYAFLVIRNLDGVGYRLLWRKADAFDGAVNFVGFSLLGIPLGILLHFIHPHSAESSLFHLLPQFVGIYLSIAIPEEFLFRGILQNFLVRTIQRGPHGLYGLLIASAVFGASHMHHAPVPNWRYAILATLAGIFYGNTYRTRHRLCASALTHAMVDTAWHFWF